ncbi:hypothetical protein [Methanofervidicoccus abyssi]|uniref:hypothetical protein n=1 Tax=Methanofervidicoccus abyssi TaxID=2082189 RepID=UPI0010348A40|nr:hypothetical protein [Methanofervidicoccus abyssi]
MGFIKYTVIFFVIACLLVWLILHLHNQVLIIILSILLGILEIAYLLYVFYKILVSKYCWIIMFPFILAGFLNDIIPGIIMVIVIYVARIITLASKRELEKNGHT